MAWRQTHDQPQHNFGSDGPFSFCSYPYLLSPRAKSKLLHTEARFLMTQVRLCLDIAESALKHVQAAPGCDVRVPGTEGQKESFKADSWHSVPACLAGVHSLTFPAACCMVLQTLSYAVLR